MLVRLSRCPENSGVEALAVNMIVPIEIIFDSRAVLVSLIPVAIGTTTTIKPEAELVQNLAGG